MASFAMILKNRNRLFLSSLESVDNNGTPFGQFLMMLRSDLLA